MEMGDRIRELREEKGLTLKELGELVGVNKSAVLKWEDGTVVNLRHNVIEKLCEVFDVSASYLMGFSDIKNMEEHLKRRDAKRKVEVESLGNIQMSFQQIQLLKEFDKLNDKQKNHVLKYMEFLREIEE